VPVAPAKTELLVANSAVTLRLLVGIEKLARLPVTLAVIGRPVQRTNAYPALGVAVSVSVVACCTLEMRGLALAVVALGVRAVA
jgi:hypothetical protein